MRRRFCESVFAKALLRKRFCESAFAKALLRKRFLRRRSVSLQRADTTHSRICGQVLLWIRCKHHDKSSKDSLDTDFTVYVLWGFIYVRQIFFNFSRKEFGFHEVEEITQVQRYFFVRRWFIHCARFHCFCGGVAYAPTARRRCTFH